MKTISLTAQKTHGLFWDKAKKCALFGVAAFILSGARLFSQPLPLAACLVCALPMGAEPIVASLGAIFGYFWKCEAAFAAEYTAVTLLMLAAVSVFQGTKLPSMPWFMPLMAACVSAVLGGIGILGGEAEISFLVVKVALCALATAYFKTFSNNFLLLAALLCAGLCGIIGPQVGFLAACALACVSGEITTAAVLGLALDISGEFGQCATAALILPTLLQKGLPSKAVYLRGAMFLLVPSSVFFCFQGVQIGMFAANAAGVALGIALRHIHPTLFCAENRSSANTLEQAAQIIDLTRSRLPQEAFSPSAAEAEEVYDAAAERICRCCPRFHRCWQHNAPQTYEALSAAAHRIIERGVAQSEDFSKNFRENCCHLEGFVVAINQELEGMLYRRRYRVQLNESRQALAQELDCLAEFLRSAQVAQKPRTANFQPRVGICSVGKNGISGDRGVCFSGGNGDFFVLLCDGMGTGEAAAKSCEQTLRFLQKLLKSGLSPSSALKLLNGSDILCGGRYTTIDLLQLDLASGSTTLYKWGAAPSYLRLSGEVKAIGEASSPPGVSVTEEAAVYSVSLKHEEILLLVSDGADAENVEKILSSYRGNSPRELAALLAGTAHEDDLTAVAVSLARVG